MLKAIRLVFLKIVIEEINYNDAFGFSGVEGIIIEASKIEKFYVREVKSIM
jgi:hypothetical protein